MSEYIFGFHAIEEVVKKGAPVEALLVCRDSERIRHLRELARDRGIPISETDEGELTRLCGTNAHKGAALSLHRIPLSMKGNLAHHLGSLRSETALFVALDGITDPQNLGAVLRSADLLGIELVILPTRHSAGDTQTVSRISSGASAHVPLLVLPNIPSALDSLKAHGFWIFGADLAGDAIDRVDFKGRVCLVMGSEGTGMRRLVREKCDFLVRIPSAGHVDSFNVSVAAGILMYEARRQQGFPFSSPRAP